MQVSAQNHEQIARSVIDWWNLAGVDWQYAESPEMLFTAPEKNDSPVTATIERAPRHMMVDASAHSIPDTPTKYPGSLADMEQFMANRSNLVEREWPGTAYQPTGPANADVTAVISMPDSSDIAENSPLSRPTHQLLANMLAACGLTIEQCYILPVACVASPSGRIDPRVMPQLATRVLHYLELIGSERILVLGDDVTRCLFDEPILNARQKQPKINHNGRKMSAISTFHPGFLLSKPRYKRHAWADLQPLLRTVSL